MSRSASHLTGWSNPINGKISIAGIIPSKQVRRTGRARTLASLRDGLLPKLMRGEVRVK